MLSLDVKDQIANYYLGMIFFLRHDHRKGKNFFLNATNLAPMMPRRGLSLVKKSDQGKYLEAKQAFLN
ncbi:MAG: hypothetical protein CM15mP58_23040 [Burkholderiaceae bacterium]|nr:MAG: hypothetical protein CM15mP58_23040 [Burkholderiaceae bacterium]